MLLIDTSFLINIRKHIVHLENRKLTILWVSRKKKLKAINEQLFGIGCDRMLQIHMLFLMLRTSQYKNLLL